MQNITRASHQWAVRPSDERFVSLTEMLEAKRAMRARSEATVIPTRSLEAIPLENDMRGMMLTGANGGPVTMTNWAFDQVARLAKAPPSYLRNLPAPLAADNINFGLLARDVEDIGVYLTASADGREKALMAATGPNYGRVFDTQIIEALIDTFGDGVTGEFKVPGEFGKDVEVTKANTTLYASDRDMFVFLADEKHRIEIPDRRNGQPGSLARGFFVWNSEVGKCTFGIATFLFDYVCCNRIIWGASQYRELKLRHTASAPDRWLAEIAPAIADYAESSDRDIVQAIAAAKKAKIDDDIDVWLKKRRHFSTRRAEAIVAAFKADEGRDPETIFDVVTGITALARSIPHQDTRVELEREAGAVMDLVAA